MNVNIIISVCHPPHGGCGLKYLCNIRTPNHCYVTLHTEGVDWNNQNNSSADGLTKSPSTRRVWIEIAVACACQLCNFVTLHTEGVDWNISVKYSKYHYCKSPSTWRVWIEMLYTPQFCAHSLVTLHTEGVDWNHRRITLKLINVICHPPHGGCGLKSLLPFPCRISLYCHPPHGGCGLK